MQLDGALFEQLAAALDADPVSAALAPADGSVGDVSTDPRRREPRVNVRAQATVIPLTDRLAAAPFQIAIRDLSPGGIGFLYTDRIALNEQFVVLLPGGRDSVAVLCQVAYYQPLGNRLYSVGAEFVRVLRQPARDESAALPLARLAPIARRAAS